MRLGGGEDPRAARDPGSAGLMCAGADVTHREDGAWFEAPPDATDAADVDVDIDVETTPDAAADTSDADACMSVFAPDAGCCEEGAYRCGDKYACSCGYLTSSCARCRFGRWEFIVNDDCHFACMGRDAM